MKYFADQKRTERVFEVLKKVGGVAYKLKLPDHSRVHHIFHVSLLKKHVGSIPVTSENFPEYNKNDVIPLEPFKVLQRRQISDKISL